MTITGRRFGHLTVVGKAAGTSSMWNCVCDCKGTYRAFELALLTGFRSDCGCGGAKERFAMRDFKSADGRVMVYTNCILVAERPDLTLVTDKGDGDTSTLLWQVAVGECHAGILADRIEERYGLVELANLLRKGSGVG